MKDEIIYESNLFQVIRRSKDINFMVGETETLKKMQYELVRRSPGVRAIIASEGKILLTYEFRYELNEWDYRLPGGKVFDSIEEYNCSVQKGSVVFDILAKLRQEMFEEANIEIKGCELINISKSGLTVEWDLYYFLVDDFFIFPETRVQKSEYEFIKRRWVDYSTALQLCVDGKISETRSAFELMRYILKK